MRKGYTPTYHEYQAKDFLQKQSEISKLRKMLNEVEKASEDIILKNPESKKGKLMYKELTDLMSNIAWLIKELRESCNQPGFITK